MLNFEQVTMAKKEAIDRYFRRYGEGSCQHSFVSLYCMSGKYGDMVCEKDGFLFVLRSNRCTETERVYLLPMGDISDKEALRRAVDELLQDARAHGASVRFETLTERVKDAVLQLFPGRFSAEYVRDYAEYLYTYEKLAELPGHEMSSKRHDINTFFRDYGGRVSVDVIRPEHIDAIRDFQQFRIDEKMHGEEDVGVEGLRKAKISYKPDLLLEKFIIAEVPHG